VERPPYEPLLRDVSEMGYSAVGRKYGVSDNAVRKWLRQYERERAIAAGNGANPAPIPTRPWPSPKRDGLDEAA
jgi:transposase-like protein